MAIGHKVRRTGSVVLDYFPYVTRMEVAGGNLLLYAGVLVHAFAPGAWEYAGAYEWGSELQADQKADDVTGKVGDDSGT